MKHRGHYYRAGLLGRSITTLAGQGGMSFAARLTCTRCPSVGTVNLRVIMPPEQIDRKFQQQGWAIDPNICPDCLAKPAKERSAMSAKPSPDAMRAQATMLTLLQTHFDVARGAYAKDWSDDKIAAETGMSKPLVVEYREACFGPIKEPAELRALRADISALETLQRESNSTITAEVASLRSRVLALATKWKA